jgi:hypothetical protein
MMQQKVRATSRRQWLRASVWKKSTIHTLPRRPLEPLPPLLPLPLAEEELPAPEEAEE